MASPFSSVIENAFEQLLSGDVNRVQSIGSRELQNLLRDTVIGNDGLPIAGLIGIPPVFTPVLVPTVFSAEISHGAGFVQNFGGLTIDDSDYQVLRWHGPASQIDPVSISFAAPDPGLPRIDLVIATPANESVDPVVRNILTDPVLRTVTPTAVFKTANPRTTLSVLTGVAAALPVPPALPFGSIALFEVFIPAAVVDSTSFRESQQTFRRIETPFAQANAVLSGCALRWPGTGTPSRPVLHAAQNNRAIIDGELIEFTSVFAGAFVTPEIFGDGLVANDPFNVVNAAPVTNDQPFYVYLVGGRKASQATRSVGTNSIAPVALVASLVAPDIITGKPLAPITPPRGGAITDGALYIGMGFTEAGSANSKPCIMQGEWVVPSIEVLPGLENFTVVGPFGPPVPLAGQPVTFVSKPPFSSGIKVRFQATPFIGPVTGRTITVAGAVPAGANAPFSTRQLMAEISDFAGVAWFGSAAGEIYIPRTSPGPHLRVFDSDAVSPDSVLVIAFGYTHHAPRMDGNSGLRA